MAGGRAASRPRAPRRRDPRSVSLEAAWDSFTARQRLRGLIGATAAEFRENREALDSVLAVDKQGHAWALANAYPDRPLEDGLEIAPSDPRGFVQLYTYEPRNGALQALVQADELAELGSIELVTALTGWQARLDDLGEDQEEVWRTLEQVVAAPRPWMRTPCGCFGVRPPWSAFESGEEWVALAVPNGSDRIICNHSRR